MNISNRTFALLILGSLLMVACGGGGGGSSTTASGSSSSTAVAVEPSQVEPIAAETPIEATSTEDLVVGDTFLFKSSYQADVRLDLSPNFDYVTICYAREDSDVLEPDFGKCLLRATLDSGDYDGELLLTNDTETLLLTAWDTEDIANVEESLWQRSLNGDQISMSN